MVGGYELFELKRVVIIFVEIWFVYINFNIIFTLGLQTSGGALYGVARK